MATGGMVGLEPVDDFRLRQMLEHLPFFAIMIDRERRFVWVNRLDPTLSPEQVLGQHVDDFIHPEWLPLAIKTIERAFDEGVIGHYEARAYGEGAVSTWYGTTVVPLPPNEHGAARALLLSNDVTKQHLAEEALHASEQRFRLLTEASPDLIAIVDQEQRLLYLNRDPPNEEGMQRHDVLGKTMAELTHPEHAAEAKATIAHVLESGVAGSFEGRSAIGDRTYVCRVICLSKGPEGARALITATDVTAQRQADRERADLEVQLQQSQKLEALGQLAGGVAHDFNNLLLVILNRAEFARTAVEQGADPSPELAAIVAAANRAQEVTRGLLTIGRKQPRRARAFDLTDLVRRSTQLLRHTIPESISVVLDLPEKSSQVHADPTQIEQVLMNLCLNARDAIDGHGTVRIRIAPAPADEDSARGWVELSVRDSGRGMDPPTLARAFEPFFTTKPAGEGTGLGLSMVHSLALQNGGRVSIESALGEGTSVQILLPAAVFDAEVAPPRSERIVGLRPDKGTILVAEDEELVRQIVVRVLTRAGFRVLEAANGRQAIDAFREHRSTIDLVILDAVMPDVGGKGAYEAIVQMAPEAKVLLSSGYAADALPEPFLQDRGLRMLPKPYRPKELLEAVDLLLHGE